MIPTSISSQSRIKRELAWKTQQAVKKARLNNWKNLTTIEEPTIEISDAVDESVDQVSRLQKELNTKTDECCRLRSQLVKPEDNAETVRTHLESQERPLRLVKFLHFLLSQIVSIKPCDTHKIFYKPKIFSNFRRESR